MYNSICISARPYCLTSDLISGTGPTGNDTTGVDVRMAPVIMLLDMLEVGRIFERGVVPVKVQQPLVDMRVPVADGPGIALEVTVVDGIEAHDRRVEPDVRLGESVPDEKGQLSGVLCRQHGLDPIERGKELIEGSFVRALL